MFCLRCQRRGRLQQPLRNAAFWQRGPHSKPHCTWTVRRSTSLKALPMHASGAAVLLHTAR
eukprot:1974155-Amphidinium_carterae.1